MKNNNPLKSINTFYNKMSIFGKLLFFNCFIFDNSNVF